MEFLSANLPLVITDGEDHVTQCYFPTYTGTRRTSGQAALKFVPTRCLNTRVHPR